jgi:hypothetical protein
LGTSVLAGSFPETTAVELPLDKVAVSVVVAEGRVEADIDDRLLCDNEEDPVVCLGFIFPRLELSPSPGDEVVLAELRSPRSLVARLALIEGVCEVVGS